MTTRSDSLILPPSSVQLLARLETKHVEYVLIGELAGAAHGCPFQDATVVVVPARFGRNLDRLSRVLRDLHAVQRGVPRVVSRQSGAPRSDLSPNGLKSLGLWRLRTDLGELDIDFEPPATAGHLDLFENARRIAVAPGLSVEVASLADLVRIAELRRTPADEASVGLWRAAIAGTVSTPA